MRVDNVQPVVEQTAAQINSQQFKQESDRRATTVPPVDDSSDTDSEMGYNPHFFSVLDNIVTKRYIKDIKGLSKFLTKYYMNDLSIDSLSGVFSYNQRGEYEVSFKRGTLLDNSA